MKCPAQMPSTGKLWPDQADPPGAVAESTSQFHLACGDNEPAFPACEWQSAHKCHLTIESERTE